MHPRRPSHCAGCPSRAARSRQDRLHPNLGNLFQAARAADKGVAARKGLKGAGAGNLKTAVAVAVTLPRTRRRQGLQQLLLVAGRDKKNQLEQLLDEAQQLLQIRFKPFPLCLGLRP